MSTQQTCLTSNFEEEDFYQFLHSEFVRIDHYLFQSVHHSQEKFSAFFTAKIFDEMIESPDVVRLEARERSLSTSR